MISLLGILKAGGVYLPLDPAYPKGRIGFMLEDSKAPVLLTQKGFDSRIAGASRSCDLPGFRPGSNRLGECGKPDHHEPAWEPRLHNLHFGIYRSAERSHGFSWLHRGTLPGC